MKLKHFPEYRYMQDLIDGLPEPDSIYVEDDLIYICWDKNNLRLLSGKVTNYLLYVGNVRYAFKQKAPIREKLLYYLTQVS